MELLETILLHHRLPNGRSVDTLRVCFDNEELALEHGDALNSLGVVVCVLESETDKPVPLSPMRFPSSDLTKRLEEQGLSRPSFQTEWNASYSVQWSMGSWGTEDPELLDITINSFFLVGWIVLLLILAGL